jgi:hypothetical protein
VFLIKRIDTGAVDILLSTSLTPTLPTNFNQRRRIGSVKTDGSVQFIQFTQNGDEFLWTFPITDINASSIATSAGGESRVVNVPTGLKVNAFGTAYSTGPAANQQLLVSSLDSQGYVVSPTGMTSMLTPAAGGYGAFYFNVRTNTSGQVRCSASLASSSLVLCSHGWIDPRGRDA